MSGLFVDRAASPQLVIKDLKLAVGTGTRRTVGTVGGANFTNVVVTPLAGNAPSTPTRPAAAAGVDRPLGSRPVMDDAHARTTLPAGPAYRGGAAWQAAMTEPWVCSHRSLREPRVARAPRCRTRRRDVVFARAPAHGGRPPRASGGLRLQRCRPHLRERSLLFERRADSVRATPGSRHPVARVRRGLYLDLARGTNELIFAVSESFGGWGLAARIESD